MNEISKIFNMIWKSNWVLKMVFWSSVLKLNFEKSWVLTIKFVKVIKIAIWNVKLQVLEQVFKV